MPILEGEDGRLDEEVSGVTCETCGGRGFELVGVEPAGVVAMRCARCGRVEKVVADLRPPGGADHRHSRYTALRERRLEQVPTAAPPSLTTG